MSSLKTLRAAHAARPINSPVAVVVGGTAGLGAAMAVKIAQYSVNPQIHLVGRSQAGADQVISRMKEVNPNGRYKFHQCDVSLLANTRALASSLSTSLPKVNFLVLSQGILTLKGRTETTEGNDVKMSLHYYSRMLFVQTLLPNLQRAAESGEDARVMSILDSVRGDVNKLDFDDLDLKKGFSVPRAATHCITMNDAAIQRFARIHPNISFQHAHPSFVNTSLGRDLPRYIGAPARWAASCIAAAPEDRAEQLFEGFSQDSMKNGAHFIEYDGTKVKGKQQISEEIQERIWKHTEGIFAAA
ncbi:hypothetical protein ONZ45_g16308 [Pleurotus djamor]|nr:hypothetical protein ONZ45_g16308 [Pleurotus djamor]